MAFFHKWSGIEKKYTIFETINIYGYTEDDLTEVNLIRHCQSPYRTALKLFVSTSTEMEGTHSQ